MGWNMIVSIFLRWLVPFLGEQLWEFLNNKKLRKIALMAVENATQTDLDNDGKQNHAREELQKEAIKLGIEVRDRFANSLVTNAYAGWCAKMEKNND